MALLRSSAVVAVYTLLSRVLGYARDILIARYLGTTGVVEAFVVAFRFPNLFRRLVAEGAFTAAFVPMFAQKLEKEGRQAALRLADQVLAVMLVALIALTVLAEIFMPQLIFLIAPGFSANPELFDAAVLFTRITMPYLLCMALVALMSGMLNSAYKFAAASFVPVLLNLIMMAALVLARDRFATPAHALSWAVALGGVAQFVFLAFACRRAGLALRLPRPRLTPEVKRLLRKMVPGAIGAGMAQFNLLVGTIIASFLSGAVTYLYFADRLYQFPLSMIGTAIGTALLPELARKLQSDGKGAMDVQNRAVEFSMLLTLPATAALIAIPGAIITVMFQYGKFTAADASATAAALAAYAAGLPGFVLIKVLSPGFFARQDTRSPVVYAVIGMVVNVALSIASVWTLGHVGIALATSVASSLNAFLLGYFLIKRGYWTWDAALKHRLPRYIGASAIMGLALWPAANFLQPWIVADDAKLRIAAIVLLVAGGMALYAALCLASGAAKVSDVTRYLRRRKKTPIAPPPE
ncbi:MAG: murein biosynthesis integral membrane protein MurJ [Alphaproteobacteria bacterium]